MGWIFDWHATDIHKGCSTQGCLCYWGSHLQCSNRRSTVTSMCYSVSRLIARMDAFFVFEYLCAFTSHAHLLTCSLPRLHPLSQQHIQYMIPYSYYTAYAYLLTVLLCFAYRRNWFQLLASRLPIRLLRRRYTYCNQTPPEERWTEFVVTVRNGKKKQRWSRVQLLGILQVPSDVVCRWNVLVRLC